MTKDEAKFLLNKAVSLHEVLKMLKVGSEDNTKLNLSLSAYNEDGIHINSDVFNDIVSSGMDFGEITVQNFVTSNGSFEESSFMYMGYRIFTVNSEEE